MRHHLASLGIVGVVAALLSGCSGTTAAATLDDLRLYTAVGDQPGDEALITGTIALTPERCVGIEDVEGVIHVAIWPAGTKLVEGEPAQITLDGPDELAVGDAVTGTGGYYSNSNELKTVAHECGAPDEVIRIRLVSFAG